MLNDQGGDSLGNVIDGAGYVSILIFITALIIIIANIQNVKKHGDTILFLFLGLPMTITAVKNTIETVHFNRVPDLSIKYPRPVDQEVFLKDSTNIKLQIDSLIAIKNRTYGGPDVVSCTIDTIIYSQSGKEIFVVYAKQYEPNDLGNDLDPDYLSAEKRYSIFWQLKEGPPNAVNMSGSFHSIDDLKKAVRQFYFNQYTFKKSINPKEPYFWKN